MILQTVLTWSCLLALAVLVPVCIVSWLHARGIRPLQELRVRFMKLPPLVRIGLMVVVGRLLVHGSTKPPSPPPLRAPAPTYGVPGFAEGEWAAGYALVRVGTNETWSFQMPTGAVEVANWRLRGAAEDWLRISGTAWSGVVFSDGRLKGLSDRGVEEFRILPTPLGVVPEANDSLVALTNAQSRVWYGASGRSFFVTWQDVLFARDTNSPVSVQAEFRENGDVVWRYDLARAGDGVTNVLAGIRAGTSAVSRVERSLAPDVTSLHWYRIVPEDAVSADRDGDGVPTAREIWQTGTDPGLWDSDGDGLDDAAELSRGTDPLARDSDGDGLVDGADPDPLTVTPLTDSDGDGLPDAWELHWLGDLDTSAEAAVRANCGFCYGTMLANGISPVGVSQGYQTVVTNELVSWQLWDRFTAMDCAEEEVLYERTVSVRKNGPFPRFYLSSRPGSAGGLRLEGLSLQWEDSEGASGVVVCPSDDSYPLPLTTNGVSEITFRLVAEASRARSREPVYLIAYSPRIEVSGGVAVDLSDGMRAIVSTNGIDTAFDVAVDWSLRPNKAPLRPGEDDVSALVDGMGEAGDVSLVRDDDGLKMVFAKPGIYSIPDLGAKGVSVGPRRLGASRSAGGGDMAVVLNPRVSWGEHRCRSRGLEYEDGLYSVNDYYPLDMKCLWRQWHRDTSGGWTCDCQPAVKTGVDDAWFITTTVLPYGSTALGKIKVGDTEVWGGSGNHVEDFSCGRAGVGGDSWGDDGEPADECDCPNDCSTTCGDGACDRFEGPDLGSFKFRIPTGTPRYGQISGFVYLKMETPGEITPDAFEHLFRDDSDTTVAKSGSAITVTCRDDRGRTLTIEPVSQGVRVTVRTTATGSLEHTWELWNDGGDVNTIRVRQVSRLNNVMADETYEYAYDWTTDGWYWQKTDNISGISEALLRSDGLTQGDGTLTETRIRYDAAGSWLGTTLRRWERIGEGSDAVLREVHALRTNAVTAVGRWSDYWRSPWDMARNGKLRLRQGDDVPWSYHDWDSMGREILRIEQRNGSAVPESFPTAWSFGNVPGGCGEIADAFMTVYDYEPLSGDDANSNDTNRVRSKIRYVVQGGSVKEIERSWHVFRHVKKSGYDAVAEEVVRAGSSGAARETPGNACATYVTFDQASDADVPLVVRGESAERLGEDGLLTETAVAVGDGRVVLTTRRSRGGMDFPTYEVEERDETRGTVLRRATCLTAGDAEIASEMRAYDDQDRLRRVVYSDGTSETNAYSCCRLLWRRDRKGRTVLRSAVTGEDRLYWADEDVWLADIQTNGHRVTQHFCDGLGRETNTVVYVAGVRGEATNFLASVNGACAATVHSFASEDGDWSEETDVYGRCVTTERGHSFGCSTALTVTGASDSGADERLYESRTDWFNGTSSFRTTCGDGWTERVEETAYDENGCRIVYERTESSDAPVVTNRVTHYDWLGRRVRVWEPTGETAYSYYGRGGIVVSETVTAGDVSRVKDFVHDGCDEPIGFIQDGVTTRRDETYVVGTGGDVWKVVRETRSLRSGEEILDGESRTRLTGLGAEETVPEFGPGVGRLTEETASVSATGARSTLRRLTGENGWELVVSSNTLVGVTRTLSRYGLVLSQEGADGVMANAYDAFGRNVLKTKSAGGETWPVSSATYTAAGDVASVTSYTNETAGTTVSYEYDAFGRVVSETDALGNVVTNVYDVLGNLLETGGATHPVRYAYDTAKRQASLSTRRAGAWHATLWEHDPATGRTQAKRYDDWTRETYTYTPDGLALTTTRPSGAWRTNGYDAERRLVSVTASDGAAETFAYDGFGRMTAASGSLVRVEKVLSDSGVATNETVSAGGRSFVWRRELDDSGRVVGKGPADGAWQTVAYAPSGQIATIATSNAVVTYDYGPDGRDLGMSIAFLGTGMTHTYRCQVARDRWTGLVQAVTNDVVGDLFTCAYYTYDALGRLVQRSSFNQGSFSEAYSYNARGELTNRTTDCWFVPLNDTYAYDDAGNYTQVGRDGATHSYSAGSANQYSEDTYDEDGRLTASDGWSYAYDSADRLTSVSSGGVWVASYDYDPLGRRIHKTTAAGERWYFYDGWNLVEERIVSTNGTTETVEYFWGRDLSGTLGGAGGVGGLLYVRKNGVYLVPIYYPNGSVRGYMNLVGALIVSYTYDGFGDTLARDGMFSGAMPFRFSTKYTDDESGLVYFGYRYYLPRRGRWLTRDPLGEAGGANLYGFCGNDAINRFDALGNISAQAATTSWIVAGKAFWYIVAELYMRPRGLDQSARLLEYSLLPFGIFDRTFDESDRLTQKIRSSDTYRRALSDVLQRCAPGKTTLANKPVGVDFSDPDLATAIAHANISFDGELCKREDGTYKGKLTVTTTDKYDFHWKNIDRNQLLLTIGNDIALLHQYTLVITPYDWVSRFTEEFK